MSRRLVVVSNRVSVPRVGESQAGGLAVALTAALRESGGLWFGWNGRLAETPGAPTLTHREGATYATIALTRREYDEYYLGYSNEVLWPVCHFMLGAMAYRRSYRDTYLAVNERFAEALLPLLDGDDMVWVNDYHLIPLAAALRRRGVDLPIGFFLHTPFPGYNLLRALPGHRELLGALCRYDLVGVQTDHDLRAFRYAAAQALDAQPLAGGEFAVAGRRVRSGVFPVGVEVDELTGLAGQSRQSRRVRRLIDSLHGRALIIGADRLDYSKGLAARLHACARFLERYPHYHRNVVLMQIATPSRGAIPEYQALRRQLEEIAGHISGQFADFDWVPVHYLHKSFARASLIGFYRTARAALVTPLRDGMNLVVKEFVAAQDPRDPGVPVLSELAGAARELDAALLVNPFDTEAVAEAIDEALAMPQAERCERHQAMIATLRRNDLGRWRQGFVECLEASRTRRA